MSEWRTSYTEGYRIEAGHPGGLEVEVVIYPRGGDVAASFVMGVSGATRTAAQARARLAQRAAAWIAADPETRRVMQAVDLWPSAKRWLWWRAYFKRHG